MQDLLINLLASVIAGAAVWAGQRLLRLRKLARKQAFFGVEPGGEVLLYVARHAGSPRENSVHRGDVACLIELASLIRECGGTPALLPPDENRPQLGRVAEYCVGGPLSNPRTAAFIRAELPGIDFVDPTGNLDKLPFLVGTQRFERKRDHQEYVLLARVQRPAPQRPAFLLIGQTAETNLAAARLLAERHGELSRRYPAGSTFCLLLRLNEPAAFGTDLVEIVEDVTLAAQTPLAETPGRASAPVQAN